MKKNVFRVKNYCYLTDEGSEDRKKMAQKSVIKRKLIFED